jgi:hypothetical protein
VTSYRIVLDGEARPAMAAASAEPRMAQGTEGRPLGSTPQTLPARLWERFRDLPRRVRAAILLIPFLFVIDMWDGSENIWFHWPAAGLIFFVLLWISLVGHKKRQ